ncbi:MAG: NHL repeat-containing protein [bacterium]
MRKIHTTILIILIVIPAILFALDDKKYDPTTLVFPSFLHTMGIRKATKTHFMIYTKNKVKVRNPQGLAIVRLKSWDDPNNKKDDDEVTGYGINSGENVIVYNTSMTSLGIYGINEIGERALKNPTGVAANEIGDVYVADTGNHRIVRFFNPKKILKFVCGIGGRGALPGQFEAPQGVALDSHGMVYVSDTGNHRIQILRPNDMLHLWFGDQGVEDGELWHPTGIAVTDGAQKWSYYKDNFIALIDLDNTRVQKFTLDGKFLKAIRLKDFGFLTGHLAYLAIDYYSNIWVTDTENHCIHKFDRNLNYLTSFGRRGKGDKEFLEPRGIAIYKRFGQVFVAEKESAQYYWIGTDIVNFEGNWDSELDIIVLDFFLTEPSFLTLYIENPNEKLEKQILKKAQYFSGPQKIYIDGNWKRIPHLKIENAKIYGNGTYRNLKPVPQGTYTFKLKIEPTYSSYNYFSKEVETDILISIK